MHVLTIAGAEIPFFEASRASKRLCKISKKGRILLAPCRQPVILAYLSARIVLKPRAFFAIVLM